METGGLEPGQIMSVCRRPKTGCAGKPLYSPTKIMTGTGLSSVPEARLEM